MGNEPVPIGGLYYSDGSRILVRPQRPQEAEWVSLDHFDRDSFRHVVDVFGQDRHGLSYFLPALEHCGMESMKEADPASFEVLGGAYARDAKGLIVEGVRKRGIDNPAAVESLGYAL